MVIANLILLLALLTTEPVSLRFSTREADESAPKTAAQIDLKKLARKPFIKRADLQSLSEESSLEAEVAALGCILLEPIMLTEFMARFGEGTDIFYDLRHQEILSAMVAVAGEGSKLDTITLVQKLRNKKTIDQVGGDSYVASLPNAIGSALSLPYYMDILWDKYLLRKLFQVCSESLARVERDSGNIEALLDQFESDVLAIRNKCRVKEAGAIKDLVGQAIDDIEKMHQRAGAVDGLATGFTDYDKMTGGLHPSEMTVIAAYPSVGKSSLLMNIAEHVCLNCSLPVGIFSLEMTAKQLVLRMLCSRSRVNLRNVRDGFLAERDFPKLTNASAKIANSLLFLEDVAEMTVFQMRAKARRLVHQHGVKLIGVDYLQLVDGGKGKDSETRETEVARVSKNIKAMAMELNVPVIVLSQLNDQGKLRESRAIGQDGDNVGILEKKKTDQDEQEHQDAEPIDWVIKKQRNGPTGPVHLTFLKCYTRFESAAKVSE